ncbi:hypothetical protein [Methylocystis sp.]|uniref:hypothetical protein n=1 Tax=Methylocystis sp. TaxID=1911079 RepID=UPI0025FDCE81|nr:hypothetical protein [Methylocystis sp.]
MVSQFRVRTSADRAWPASWGQNAQPESAPEPHSGKICSAVDLNHQFIGSCVYDHDIGRSFRSFDFSGDRNSVADIIEPVVQNLVDADFKGTFDELRRRFCVHELR